MDEKIALLEGFIRLLEGRVSVLEKENIELRFRLDRMISKVEQNYKHTATAVRAIISNPRT